ncbi:MAG TPA: hypothetical protein VL017_12615, partial [Devosia sp.]|nr:hypothetical protein [Devosia sp.]
MRANGEIQFAPVQMPEKPPPPSWLLRFLDWLSDLLRPAAEKLGLSWPVLKWILLGIVVLAALTLLWRLLAPIARIRFARAGTSENEQGWVPDRVAAIALLEDADRLAAEGRFDEATHLLLQRSVNQIAQARPDWLEP